MTNLLIICLVAVGLSGKLFLLYALIRVISNSFPRFPNEED